MAPGPRGTAMSAVATGPRGRNSRSEEHTSELQSRSDLVCRLLLEKKKSNVIETQHSPPLTDADSADLELPRVSSAAPLLLGLLKHAHLSFRPDQHLVSPQRLLLA